MPDADVQRLFEEIRKLPVEEKLDLAAQLVRAGKLEMARSVAQGAVNELDERALAERARRGR